MGYELVTHRHMFQHFRAIGFLLFGILHLSKLKFLRAGHGREKGDRMRHLTTALLYKAKRKTKANSRRVSRFKANGHMNMPESTFYTDIGFISGFIPWTVR